MSKTPLAFRRPNTVQRSAAAAAISLPGITVAQTVAAPPATSDSSCTVDHPATAPGVFARWPQLATSFNMCGRMNRSAPTSLTTIRGRPLKVPDHSLNYAVLRGLDVARSIRHQGAERVLLAVKGCPRSGRRCRRTEALTMKHVLGVLEANRPQDWDQIIVVVPKCG